EPSIARKMPLYASGGPLRWFAAPPAGPPERPPCSAASATGVVRSLRAAGSGHGSAPFDPDCVKTLPARNKRIERAAQVNLTCVPGRIFALSAPDPRRKTFSHGLDP